MTMVSKSPAGIIKWFLAGMFILIAFIIILGYQKSDVPVSYLSEIGNSHGKKFDNGQKVVELGNDWYKLIVDKTGNIMIKAADNRIIISCLSYNAEYEGSEMATLSNVSVWLETDSTAIIEGNINKKARVRIIVSAKSDDPEANFVIQTRYYDSTTVIREALVAYYDVPVTEVYNKSRQIDVERFHREYWLGNEGLKLGSGSRSLMIYHPVDISSLQLETKKKIIVINLESQLDHPFIHFPYQKDGGGKWINRSAAIYKEGFERTDAFSIIIGNVPDVIPRLMLVPDGYLAGYVFTEHADSANIRSHRAAYFGSEKTVDITKATSGFAGHDIPVTKSVFFEEFDAGLSDIPESGDLSEREYSDFLDQLYSTGLYDLCLHTPERENSDREYLENAISTMRQRYDASTWIDHGIFEGNSNREAFVADGLNPSSEYFAADLWTKYGTDYFWSPAVEAIRFSKPGISIKEDLLHLRFVTLSKELWRRVNYRKSYLGENSITSFLKLMQGHFPMFELNSLQPLESSALPTPLYWQNLTIAGKFYSWPTEYVYNGMPADNSEEWLATEKRALDLLVSDRGFYFNHGYYVRNINDNRILSNINGILFINPVYDELLSYMDLLRDKGDLLITTVKNIMDYWLLIENVSFKYNADGSIEIKNENDTAIQGLSLAIRAKMENIRLDEEVPLSKSYGDDTILWFDIAAKGERTLRFIN